MAKRISRVSMISPGVITVISFSNLLVFSDSIQSKPTQAGFWMILVILITSLPESSPYQSKPVSD